MSAGEEQRLKDKVPVRAQEVRSYREEELKEGGLAQCRLFCYTRQTADRQLTRILSSLQPVSWPEGFGEQAPIFVPPALPFL